MKAFLLILLCAPAFADDLVYQSQTLAGTAATIVGSTTENSSPINDVYSVTVSISGPLAPNLNMAVITPLSWVVTCESCAEALSSSPPTVPPPLIYTGATAAVFVFSTDMTGKITAWSFGINGNSSVGDGSGGTQSSNSGSFVSSSSAGDSGISDAFTLHEYLVTTSGPPGTWTQSSLSYPNAPPAPAPTPRRWRTGVFMR